MGEIIKFFTFDSLYEYVRAQLDAPIDFVSTETYAYWNEIIGDMIGKRARAIPKYNSYTGAQEWSWEFETFDSDNIIPGKTIEVSSNTQSSTAATAEATMSEAIGGGGAKTPPTMTKVVTDLSSGESVAGETAKGIKNVGVGTKVPVQSILTGIMAAYGLYSLAITARNWHTWEDVFNTVFPDALPQDATFDDVVNFAKGRYQLYISGVIEAHTLNVYVPESIVERMYNFLAAHMEEDGTIGGLELDLLSFGLLNGTWSRDYPTSRLFTYIPAATGNQVLVKHVYFGENLLYNAFVDFSEQIIGLGFTLSQSTANIWINAAKTISEWIVANAPSVSVLTYKYVQIDFQFTRWHAPRSQPVSADELEVYINFHDDQNMVIDADTGVTCNIWQTTTSSPKFLKYGKTGENVEDFGYECAGTTSYGGNQINSYTVYITFPANTPTIEDSGIEPEQISSYMRYSINGYCDNALDTDYHPSDPEDLYQEFHYCNLGWKGDVKNYKPDTYLSDICGKDDKEGEQPKKRPAAASTGLAWDDRYMQWAEQQKKRGTTNNQGQNTIATDVPVYVPNGGETADQIINHGYNNPNDPQSFVDDRDQQKKQNGDIPDTDPMDRINEDIEETVKEYNDSRTTPDSAPDPVPDDEPLPYYPTDPPVEPGGETDEPPEPGTMEGVEASGMVSVYNPTKAEIISFSGWLWSSNFLDNFLKIFQNPMDGIIGLHILYATPSTASTSENIRVGYLDSGVSSKVVDKQFVEIDCGYVTIPEYYGTAIDYEPYVQIHCYLPFVGIVSLKPNDVIGKKLYIIYGVDVITGTCLAMLTAKDKTSEILLYTYSGNCATQVPISGGNYAQIISGLASMAVGIGAGVATGNPIAVAGGVVAGVMSSHLDVTHSGSIGANAGAMGPRKPYVVITRKSAYDAGNYNHFYGYPANKTIILGSCRGYTRVKSIHIDSIGIATDNEKLEIETLLKQGVIIK